jgi:hypothetical protein
MSRLKFAILTIAVALSAAAMFASSASAAISFEWKVNGKSLAEGESRAFDANSGSQSSVLSGSAAGLHILILFHVILYDGTHIYPPFLIDLWLLELPLVHVSNCSIGSSTKTAALKGEIVEGAVGGVGNGEVDVLFAPTSGTTFATFEFGGSSCVLKGATAGLTGSVLSLVKPQRTEVEKNDLVLEANTKEYHNRAGEFKKAGLLFAGEAATFNGLSLILLTSGEKFGAF